MVENDKKIKEKTLLRFGIMCNGFTFQKWQADIIISLINNRIQPSLLIVDNRPPEKKNLYSRIKKYPYSKLIFRIYTRYFFRPEVKNPVNLYSQFKEINSIKCTVIKKGFSEYFSDDDITIIKNNHLDFILRFGFNIIRGDILTVSKYGIWSFHHGNEQDYRGGPPGLWEIYRNDPVNGFILQKLTNKLDAGIILKKGFSQTIKHSWKNNINQIYSFSTIYPLQVCNDIYNGNADYLNSPETQTNALLYKNPGNWKFFLLFLKLFWNKLSFQYNVFHQSVLNPLLKRLYAILLCILNVYRV